MRFLFLVPIAYGSSITKYCDVPTNQVSQMQEVCQGWDKHSVKKVGNIGYNM